MLYRCVQFININGSVCGHVIWSRGIKQGDSISSQLYIMPMYYDSHICFRIANVFLDEFKTLDILNSYSPFYQAY